ncbi:MAG TPA: FAD-dependent oxidoreductase [Actinocrinis sp.]|nr:FAD-dependent oxidoreductase [Actinocrinis sp.]
MGEIVVIGAGAAGLAAAARLSRGGNTVTVLEQAAAVGGALVTGRDAASAEGFDTGAHTLTMPAVYRDLFVKTGSRKASAKASFEENVELRPVDPVRRHVFADGTVLDLPNSSRSGLLRGFDAALGPGAGRSWLRVTEHGAAAWELLRPAWFEAPRATGRDLQFLLADRANRRVLTPRKNLRKLAKSWFDDPRLGLLLDEYALAAGADPRRAPGILAMAPYLELAFGAWRIAGGLSSLAEALHRRALARGVTFRLGCRAVRISTAADGSVDGVLLADGTRLPADTVIVAADVTQLAELTAGAGGSARAGIGHSSYPSHSDYSHSLFTVLLRVPGAPAQPHEAVYFAGHDKAAVESRLADVFGQAARPVADPTIRLCVSAEQPECWSVHTIAARHGNGPGALDWTAPGLAESYARTLTACLVNRGILSGETATGHELVRFISPADRESATGSPGGAAYGPAANDLESVLLRSAITRPAAGLHHVGASARPGSGLPFAALSAWHLNELVNPPKATRSG